MTRFLLLAAAIVLALSACRTLEATKSGLSAADQAIGRTVEKVTAPIR